MGCKQSRNERAAAYAEPSDTSAQDVFQVLLPEDDYVLSICGLSKGFALAGSEGWLYLYDQSCLQTAKIRAHQKALNRLLEHPELLFAACSDGVVQTWRQQHLREGEAARPVRKLEGHTMAVNSMDLVQEGLFTGSRDCSVQLWDVNTGQSIQKNKILRNVVTAVRRCGSSTLVQASEDLQLRLWDTRNLSKPAIAVPSGPNQLICLDVPEEGQWVACGSKGFSRENCEVKLFDLRGGLRQQAALPCADQTIEALRCADRQHVVLASKDGHLRGLSLTEPTEPKVLWERRGGSAYTALGVCDGSCLAAGAGPEGLSLELFALSDLKNAPTLLAS